MRNWRGLMLGAIALTVAGTGVGIATAGESDQRPPQYWPTVEEKDMGPAADASLAFPTIEDASLVCATGGGYELRFTASSQPGSGPRRGMTPPAAGEVVVQAGFRTPVNLSNSSGGWGEGGDRIPLQGDFMAIGDATPTNPGWLVFAGTRAVRALPAGLKIPAGLDQGVRLNVEIARHEQQADGTVAVAARKQTQTLLPFPTGC